MRKPTAFTLIELLVVISIIALLIGILLPALGAARNTARISASASNQRQIGIAMATYQADNKDYFPLWQRSASLSDNANNPARAEYMVEEPVDWYWTTKLAVDGYLPSIDLYADPSFAGANVDFTGTINTSGGRGATTSSSGITRENQDRRIFNWIHYGYNYVWIGSNLGSNRPATKRANAPVSQAARIIDMDDPTSVIVTSGVKDWTPSGKNMDDSTPAINEGQEYGAHVFLDYPFDGVNNIGRPHARYNNQLQNSWADGHVSTLPMPFTQEQQDATTNGHSGGDVFLYASNALGNVQGWGSAGGRGGAGAADKGNFLDLRSGNPDL